MYYTYFSNNLGSFEKERNDINDLILLHNFASLPETKCNNDDCIDVLKLIALKDLIEENKGAYISKFKNRRIIVENVYPINQEKSIECIKEKIQQSSFPNNCGYFIVYDNLNNDKQSYIVSLPVSLYFSNTNEFRIGVLKLQGADR